MDKIKGEDLVDIMVKDLKWLIFFTKETTTLTVSILLGIKHNSISKCNTYSNNKANINNLVLMINLNTNWFKAVIEQLLNLQSQLILIF